MTVILETERLTPGELTDAAGRGGRLKPRQQGRKVRLRGAFADSGERIGAGGGGGRRIGLAVTRKSLPGQRGAGTISSAIRQALPRGTVVAHRTGTSAGVDGTTAAVNDVGIVTLPDGSHVAIAVFVKRSTGGMEPAERAIARTSRAVYDHWPRPLR